jgi:hypothetical protein
MESSPQLYEDVSSLSVIVFGEPTTNGSGDEGFLRRERLGDERTREVRPARGGMNDEVYMYTSASIVVRRCFLSRLKV